MILAHLPFISLHYVSLLLLVAWARLLLRQCKAKRSPPGRRTFKRLQQEAPQILFRMASRDRQQGLLIF